MTTKLITREEWGARYADGFGPRPLPATLAVVHHTVTIAPDLIAPYDDDYAAIRQLERIGEQRFGGGMSYPRLVTPVGLAFEGLSADRKGAHLRGHNTEAMSYALVGDYSTNPPTRRQIGAVADLILADHGAGALDEAKLDGGHRDYGQTACPGNAGYAALHEIRDAVLTGRVPPPYVPPRTERSPANLLPAWPLPRTHYLGPPSRDPDCHSGYYRATDREVVKLMQTALRRRGWNVSVDGLYGAATAKVVAGFQREKKLAVDGLCGYVTWAAIDNAPVTK